MRKETQSFRTLRSVVSNIFFHSKKGLSLLELLVALLVLQIAITGFAQFLMGGLDLSRKIRINEIAQILAQNKMEELLQTVPAEGALPSGESGPRLLNEMPLGFSDAAPGVPESDSFRWLAELAPAPHNPKLVDISLHVYAVRSRPAQGEGAALAQPFFLSDDKKRFTLVQAADDGSVEVMQGREQLRLVTAIAVP